jgi:hypothetical protein
MGAPTVPHVSPAFLERIIGKPRDRGRPSGRGSRQSRRGSNYGSDRQSRFDRQSSYDDMSYSDFGGDRRGGPRMGATHSRAPWSGRGRQSGRNEYRD